MRPKLIDFALLGNRTCGVCPDSIRQRIREYWNTAIGSRTAVRVDPDSRSKPTTETANAAVPVLISVAVRLFGMPGVGILALSEPNAFATGMNRNNALVAVSSGLLSGMQDDEMEAVLGHVR